MPDQDPLVAKIGNVTKKRPTLRYSDSGKAYAKFDLAVTPYAPPGEPKPETVYYQVTAFGSLAENIAASVDKGHRVLVVGRGKTEIWPAKDNYPERTVKVILADGVGHDLRFVVSSITEPDTPPLTSEPF